MKLGDDSIDRNTQGQVYTGAKVQTGRRTMHAMMGAGAYGRLEQPSDHTHMTLESKVKVKYTHNQSYSS